MITINRARPLTYGGGNTYQDRLTCRNRRDHDLCACCAECWHTSRCSPKCHEQRSWSRHESENMARARECESVCPPIVWGACTHTTVWEPQFGPPQCRLRVAGLNRSSLRCSRALSTPLQPRTEDPTRALSTSIPPRTSTPAAATTVYTSSNGRLRGAKTRVFVGVPGPTPLSVATCNDIEDLHLSNLEISLCCDPRAH